MCLDLLLFFVSSSSRLLLLLLTLNNKQTKVPEDKRRRQDHICAQGDQQLRGELHPRGLAPLSQQAREGLEQQAQQAQQVPQDERLQVRLQNDRHQDRTHFDTQLCQFLFIKT